MDNSSWFSRISDLFQNCEKKGTAFVLHDYLELARKFGTLLIQLEPKFTIFKTILESDFFFLPKSGLEEVS